MSGFKSESCPVCPGILSGFARNTHLLTDAFTDELFRLEGSRRLVANVSRLVVDVERFPDDDDEPMSARGMGAIYTRTARGNQLRRPLSARERHDLLGAHYHPHHRKLTSLVEGELRTTGSVLIIDCHSLPSQPLPCELDQSVPRPEFCIRTDPFHTPARLTETALTYLQDAGYRVLVDSPYRGTLVPMAYYQRDERVRSIMIEVNRALYMDEGTGERADGFAAIKNVMTGLLTALSN